MKAAACAKHFAVHSGPEGLRHHFDAKASLKDMWETYLPAFKALVQEGDVREVMCAYNSIDGEPCCGNTTYLQQILRNEWGFKGMVVTDWGVKNNPVAEVKAGNDLKMHCGYPEDLKAAYDKGELTTADLELCTKRILEMMIRMAD